MVMSPRTPRLSTSSVRPRSTLRVLLGRTPFQKRMTYPSSSYCEGFTRTTRRVLYLLAWDGRSDCGDSEYSCIGSLMARNARELYRVSPTSRALCHRAFNYLRNRSKFTRWVTLPQTAQVCQRKNRSGGQGHGHTVRTPAPLRRLSFRSWRA